MMKMMKTTIAVIFIGVILMGCDSYSEKNKALDLYQDILKECEWVWENAEEFIEIYYGDNYNGQFTYPFSYDGIRGYALGAEKYGYTLCYCIKDINHDNIPELIVGVKYPEEDESMHSATREDGCVIRAIYYYHEGEVGYLSVERYQLNLYNDGIIEEQYGVISNWKYQYYQITKESGLTPLRMFGYEYDDEKKDEAVHYYSIDGKDSSLDEENLIEMTEEEFYEQKNVYTELGEEELEWKVVEGLQQS